MKPATKKRLLIAGILLGLLLLVPAWFAYRLGVIPRIDRLQSFHAPVFGRDGRDVFYLTRNAWGISWGPGIEFFTSPASVVVLGDRFALQRTNWATGETKTLHEWRVPHQKSPKKRYRNYLFGIPECELAWEGNSLHYKIGLDFLPNGPPSFSVKEWSTGSFNADTGTVLEQDAWRPGYYQTNPWSELVLSGPLEIIDLKSRALIINDSETAQRTVLRVSDSGGSVVREEVVTIDLKEYSHRAQLERSRTVRETYSNLVSRFRSQGLPEGEAVLKANDEMEKLGYYPKTPRLVAAKIDKVSLGPKVFEISVDEFRFGLFPDIEAAIAKPGTEIHFGGKYITHRDFTTSRKLNDYLEAGNATFIVKSEKGLFLLTLE